MVRKKMPLLVLFCFCFSVVSLFAQIDLTVDRVEITQVIQDRNLAADQDNIIRLVGFKNTVARVYVGFTGSADPVPNVTALIHVYQDDVEVDGSPVLPDGPITAPVPPASRTRVDPRSSSENQTINFTLPPLMGGNVRIDATVNPDRTIVETDYDNNSLTVDGLVFECRRIPDLVYQPINYRPTADYPNPNLPDVDMIAPGVGDAFVRGIYPIYDLNYRLAPGTPLEWNQDINRSSGSFQTQMAIRRRMMDPMPDFMYSWFPGNPFGGNGQASPSGMVAFGNTDAARWQRTFAHEIGHLFGRGHNSRRLDQVGFYTEDQLGLGRVKGTNLYDIMAAGRLTNQAWIDIQTYNAFLDRPILFCPSGGGPNKTAVTDMGNYLFMTGTLYPDGTARLNPAYTLNGRTDYTMPSEDPTHWLIIQDGAGAELYRLPFDARPAEYDGDIENPSTVESSFSLAVPAFDNIGRLIIEKDGEVLDVMERRADAPTIAWDSPANFIMGKDKIVWSADAAPGMLTYSVQYSPDNGFTWYPLAIDLKESILAIDGAELGKTDRGIIRVLATDGLNTTVLERNGLNIF
ncbi:MAG: hypothetical protein HYR55_17445 [Acidobacteria bacterium]|nr:hypothetical protein [Acidobacteriota bacterium]MBI3657070.1 hypothetical protein [Acidobacteriota bacterium]